MVTLDGLGYKFAGWEVSGGAWAAEQLPGGTPDPDHMPRRWENLDPWAVLQATTITAGCSIPVYNAPSHQTTGYETSRLTEDTRL